MSVMGFDAELLPSGTCLGLGGGRGAISLSRLQFRVFSRVLEASMDALVEFRGACCKAEGECEGGCEL